MKQVFIFIYLLFLATAMQAKDAKAFLLTKNEAVTLYCHKNEALVVQTALNLFRQDYVKVLAASPRTESLKKARMSFSRNLAGLTVGIRRGYQKLKKKQSSHCLKR